MKQKVLAAVGVLAAVLGAATAESAAQYDPGRSQYQKYCGACHGMEGKGDGVAAGFMRPKPNDLTLLSRNAGGTFPFVEVMQVIDGRHPIKAHGDAAMPVWGEVFTAESSQTIEMQARVRGKVLLITEYLASIQRR